MMNAPKKTLVKPGAYVASIAHAIFVCRHPALNHEQSWDGDNYTVQDSQGSRGAISFVEDCFVGACFYEGSPNNPIRRSEAVDNDRYIVGIPRDLRILAMTETFQYLVDEFQGQTMPILTAAFWGDSEHELVQHVSDWGDVFDNGACLFKNQFLPVDQAMESWAAEFALSDLEVDLVMSIYREKSSDFSRNVKLPMSAATLFKTLAVSDTGWNACKDALEALRIHIE